MSIVDSLISCLTRTSASTIFTFESQKCSENRHSPDEIKVKECFACWAKQRKSAWNLARICNYLQRYIFFTNVKVEVKSVLRIISAHIVGGTHGGILKISMEYGMCILSNFNLNIQLSVQSWKFLWQHGGVVAHRKELLTAKCKALGSFLQKRVQQNEKNAFLKDMRQKILVWWSVQTPVTAERCFKF